MTLKQFLNAFVPRFITEDVAFEKLDDGYSIICPLWLLDAGEQYDGIGQVRSFNIFGWAICPKLIGSIDKTPGFKK
jgi:hypothetical protein